MVFFLNINRSTPFLNQSRILYFELACSVHSLTRPIHTCPRSACNASRLFGAIRAHKNCSFLTSTILFGVNSKLGRIRSVFVCDGAKLRHKKKFNERRVRQGIHEKLKFRCGRGYILVRMPFQPRASRPQGSPQTLCLCTLRAGLLAFFWTFMAAPPLSRTHSILKLA